jgi:hypothetical protein
LSIKRFGTKLHGKITAQIFRRHCQKYLKTDTTLVLNMAGVKEVTPGFALEAFGKLYIDAKKRGARIEFSHASKVVRPVLLSSVKMALTQPF